MLGDIEVEHQLKLQNPCSSQLDCTHHDPAMKKTPSVATQHASEAQSSSSSANGGASQVVGANDPAIHALITDLIEEVVKFGRFPKYSHSARNKEDREENCFYWRLQRKKKALPSDAWAELERIVASQLDAKHQELLAEVRDFGRFPRRFTKPQNEEDRKEHNFYKRLYRQKEQLLPAIWEEMQNIGASQPDGGQQLVDAVKRLGYYPKEAKTNKEEAQLAHDIRKARATYRFSPALLTELDELRLQSVHPLDVASQLDAKHQELLAVPCDSHECRPSAKRFRGCLSTT